MMPNVYKSKLDIKNVRPAFRPVFIQYDHARLEIEVLDKGLPYDLSNVERIEFTHVREDNTVIIQSGEILTNGKGKFICYEYLGSEMDIIGTIKTSFTIFDGNNKKVSSHAFDVVIVRDLRDDIFSPAEPNFGLLQTLISDVQHIKESGGIVGEQGERGEDGIDGKPFTYEDFTSEQLAALKGPQGDPGTIPQYLTSNALLQTKESSFAFVEDTRTKPTAYITLTDDDGNNAVWTKLRPISEEKGVPFVLALFGTSPLSDERGLYLQNELGWEITSHSYQHEPLPTFTGQALDDELALSKRHLIAKGYNVTNIIYPYGQVNEEVRNVAAKYFNCGARVGEALSSSGIANSTPNGLNMQPVAQFDLGRVALGSFTADGQNTLSYYKSIVDLAVRDGSWLIFMMHCGSTEHDETQQQYLREVIDYIHSLNAKIVTLEEGNRIFGNKLYVSNKTDINAHAPENLLAITNDGKLFTEIGEIKSPATFNLPMNTFTASDPITSYPSNRVTIFPVSNAAANGFPDNTGGTVLTSRIGSNEAGAFNYQEYTQILTNRTFKRFWSISTNAWTEWKEIKLIGDDDDNESVKIISMNSYTAASPITAYPPNKMTIFNINYAGGVGFPNNSAGTVITYRLSGNGWDYQEFKEYNNHNKHVRYVNADGTWSTWRQFGMI